MKWMLLVSMAVVTGCAEPEFGEKKKNEEPRPRILMLNGEESFITLLDGRRYLDKLVLSNVAIAIVPPEQGSLEIGEVISDEGSISAFDYINTSSAKGPGRNRGPFHLKIHRVTGKLQINWFGEKGGVGEEGQVGTTGNRGTVGKNFSLNDGKGTFWLFCKKDQPIRGLNGKVTTFTFEDDHPLKGGTGERGNRGNIGGKGHPGGDIGDLYIEVPPESVSQIEVLINGGVGGEGGPGGQGGAGGGGGAPGELIGNCGKRNPCCDPPPEGSPGPQGEQGPQGPPGENGKTGRLFVNGVEYTEGVKP